MQRRLPPSLSKLKLKNTKDNHPYAERIRDYFNGDLAALHGIPHAQEGSAFYQRVWRIMEAIPPGQTLTYKEVASRLGQPTAVRAVGNACGGNRLILVVPCHRIIKSDGGLGGYVYGATVKRGLLAHEDQAKK